MYVFDFFSERAFFMELFNVFDGKIKYPELLRIGGETPQQIEVGDMISVVETYSSYGLDEDLKNEFPDIDDLDLDSLPNDSY